MSVPITPISAPCTTKIFMIRDGVAPSVRRMAMSGCLSVTAITSVETILNAATATISVRMMPIMVFSDLHARKKLAWVRVQSRRGRHRPTARRWPWPPRARAQVLKFEPHALHAVGAQRCISAASATLI